MGFRFQKRIRIFKGLTLNLSKSGTSWTIGRRGASVNVRKGNVTGTVGLPGSGVSYRKTLSQRPRDEAGDTQDSGLLRFLFWCVVITIAVYMITR